MKNMLVQVLYALSYGMHSLMVVVGIICQDCNSQSNSLFSSHLRITQSSSRCLDTGIFSRQTFKFSRSRTSRCALLYKRPPTITIRHFFSSTSTKKFARRFRKRPTQSASLFTTAARYFRGRGRLGRRAGASEKKQEHDEIEQEQKWDQQTKKEQEEDKEEPTIRMHCSERTHQMQ